MIIAMWMIESWRLWKFSIEICISKQLNSKRKAQRMVFKFSFAGCIYINRPLKLGAIQKKCMPKLLPTPNLTNCPHIFPLPNALRFTT